MTAPSIVDFLNARLAEDEAAAEAAEDVNRVLDRVWGAALDAKEMMTEPDATEEHYLNKQRHHFERAKAAFAVGDPARVLREVEAKRHLLNEYKDTLGAVYVGDYPEEHVPTSDILEEFVISMAGVYSDHPDYDQSWSTT